MVESNLIHPRLNLEVETDEGNGEKQDDEDPKHGVGLIDLETVD